jgi:hypothetical protein
MKETHFNFKDDVTESEVIEKDIPCTWLPKVSMSGCTYIIQNRL